MNFGEKLSHLRNQKGLSQYEAAEKLGIKRPRYNAWEQGISKPRADMVNKIAEFFGVTPDYLLGFESTDSIPDWATAKDKRDFKKLLEDDTEIMFDGIPFSKEHRQRVMDVLTGLFWEAKQMNKHKKKPDSEK
jgi:transcriptional regulator with XRE-family HTH domain